MALFLILCVPIWFLLIVSFYRTPSRGWLGLFLPFLGGLLIGMATLLITLGLLTRMPFNMEIPGLYRWAWIRGPGWPLLVAVPIVTAVYFRRPTSYSRIREIASWLSGTAFVYTFWMTITPDPGFDIYRIFLMPFVWIAAISSAAWLLDRGLRLDRWPRYLLMAASLVSSSLITLLPVLYTVGEMFYALLVAILISVLVTFLAFMDSRGRLG